jgi:transcription antitermination factor NusG
MNNIFVKFLWGYASVLVVANLCAGCGMIKDMIGPKPDAAEVCKKDAFCQDYVKNTCDWAVLQYDSRLRAKAADMAKFKYGDRVKVIAGFYTGSSGVVIDLLNADGVRYKIKLDHPVRDDEDNKLSLIWGKPGELEKN